MNGPAPENSEAINLRPAVNQDSGQIIELIDSVLREYDDKVCLDGCEADLLDIEVNYLAKGGMFWVLERNGQIVGTHAALPWSESSGACHFRRLYLHPSLRGTKWSAVLMQVTIDWAIEHNFQLVEFWSDTRFHRAHKFFTKFGFTPDGRTRVMTDGIDPYSERYFALNFS